MTFIPRTDLALEARELWQEAHPGEMDGILFEEREADGFPISRVTVTDERGSSALCKPKGTYITLELQRLLRREDGAFNDGVNVLAGEIRELLELSEDSSVLVIGLGNPAITPDAVGHLTVRSTMVTRHLAYHMPEHMGGLRQVSALEPGVLGTTGIESAKIVAAVAREVHPSAVIAVDALASRSSDRLCRTVQLSDAGIIPGSGVGNGRLELSQSTLGIPVIAVGTPTVIDAATLASDAAADAGMELDEDRLRSGVGTMIVTPRDIDSTVADISRFMAYAINLALHPGLSVSDVDMFVN